MLIRRATLRDGRSVDLHIVGGRIAAMGRDVGDGGARAIDARGGVILPGLHDHHVHLAATAAAMASVRCGPPEVGAATELAARLSVAGEGWLRGIGYHESVAGPIDRDWLDAIVPTRPVRIQHRSGRMWVFNSAGLDAVLSSGLPPPAGLEHIEGRWSGRLYDEDAWVARALRGSPPALAQVSRRLSGYGVSGVTDMSPANDTAAARYFADQRGGDHLVQRVVMAGRMDRGRMPSGIDRGPFKLHLHEAHLPDLDDVVAMVRAAHDRGRGVAVHCVTAVELTFTLAAFREAGAIRGDRVEHASVASDELVTQVADLGLAVVAQPNFVFERGDAYRRDIARAEWPSLYRLRAFRRAGIVLAGGSDTPFGAPDPWAAMAAAVSRRTRGGDRLGAGEALNVEEALDLFLADPQDLARTRTVAVGAVADLCLLEAPWRAVRGALAADRVRMTIIGGRIVHDRIDEPPVAGESGADPLAR